MTGRPVLPEIKLLGGNAMNIDIFSVAAIIIIVVGVIWAFYEENIRK